MPRLSPPKICHNLWLRWISSNPYFNLNIFRYGVREYACTAVDMIARRLRLSFLNSQAAMEALPGIIDIMAEELNWSNTEKEVGIFKIFHRLLNSIHVFFLLKKKRQHKLASDFLALEMGLVVNRASREKIPINLTDDEIKMYKKRFEIMDKDKKGFISINDIRRGLKVTGCEILYFFFFCVLV